MPRFHRSLLLFVLCLLPGLGHAAGKCERLVATGNPEYPPYLWRDPENPKQLIGANADLLKQIAKELGLKVDILYTGPWSRAQDEVRTGRVDPGFARARADMNAIAHAACRILAAISRMT